MNKRYLLTFSRIFILFIFLKNLYLFPVILQLFIIFVCYFLKTYTTSNNETCPILKTSDLY